MNNKFNTKLKLGDKIGNIIQPRSLKIKGYCIRCGNGVFNLEHKLGICPICSMNGFRERTRKEWEAQQEKENKKARLLKKVFNIIITLKKGDDVVFDNGYGVFKISKLEEPKKGVK